MPPQNPIGQGWAKQPGDDVHTQGDTEHFQGEGDDEGQIDTGRAAFALFVEGQKNNKEAVQENPKDDSAPLTEMLQNFILHDEPQIIYIQFLLWIIE